MKYYKLIKNDRVVDVLTHLEFVKWNERHSIPFRSDESDAEGFLSSDQTKIYTLPWYRHNPKHTFDVVDQMVEIDEDEYSQLKALNYKTPQEIIDAYTEQLLEGGIL